MVFVFVCPCMSREKGNVCVCMCVCVCVCVSQGWKYLHGDVFRIPDHPNLLAAMLGVGTQMLFIATFIFVLALVGVFYPYNRGALLSACVLLYALTAGIAGELASSSPPSSVHLCCPHMLRTALSQCIAHTGHSCTQCMSGPYPRGTCSVLSAQTTQLLLARSWSLAYGLECKVRCEHPYVSVCVCVCVCVCRRVCWWCVLQDDGWHRVGGQRAAVRWAVLWACAGGVRIPQHSRHLL